MELKVDKKGLKGMSLSLEKAAHGYEIFNAKKDNCIKIVLKPG